MRYNSHTLAMCTQRGLHTPPSPLSVGSLTFSLNVSFSFQENFHLILSKLLMEMCVLAENVGREPCEEMGSEERTACARPRGAVSSPCSPCLRCEWHAACTPH